MRDHQLAGLPLGGGSCLRRTRHPFTVSGQEGRHRRLSVCSLPVLKQSEGSLGSLTSVAQSVSGRTWQSARWISFLLVARFLGRSLAAIFRGHKVPLSSIHRHQICNELGEPPQAWLDWHSLSASLWHTATQDHGRAWELTSLLRLGTNWMFLFRCLESGVRIDFSAELLWSPQSPQ